MTMKMNISMDTNIDMNIDTADKNAHMDMDIDAGPYKTMQYWTEKLLSC